MEAVIFYSYNGHTKGLAEKRAKELGAKLIEIKETKRPSTLKAYSAGCWASLRQKKWPIIGSKCDLKQYDKITVMCPIWAGFPAPPALSIFDMLPAGKEICAIMVSASGQSNDGCKDRVKKLIEAKGCKMAGFQDIKGGLK